MNWRRLTSPLSRPQPPFTSTLKHMQQSLGESPLVIIQTRCPVEIIRYL